MNKDLQTISQILSKYLDPRENQAFVFGSRPTGTAVPYSDYDIGVKGAPISAETYFNLEQEFEDSDLPFLVQIVDFNDVSNRFAEVASQETIPINMSHNA